jgi:eukaryotic-like serine/threonine-protein kinase
VAAPATIPAETAKSAAPAVVAPVDAVATPAPVVIATAPVTTTTTTSSVAASGATSRLQLAVTPWGEVFVDNQKQGVSPPLREIVLSPGPHRIEIRNAGFRRYRETIVLAPRATAKIKHKFE